MASKANGLVAALLLAGGAFSWPASAEATHSDTISDEVRQPVPGLQSADTAPTPLKTLTFLSLASINDFGFGYVFGGLATGGAMVAANLTTGWGLYYLHETAWAAFGHDIPASEDTAAARTATFTVANSARIFGLGLLVTGNAAIAGAFVAFNALGDAAAYVVTDQLWLRWPSDTAGSERLSHRHRPRERSTATSGTGQ